MGGFLSGIIALLIAASAAQSPEEIPAEPLNRAPPSYPTSCMPPPGQVAAPQSVTVAFDVNEHGFPENVRVVESTDGCFEEVAVAAVRSWKYVPRSVNGRARPQEELQTTFTFIFQEATLIEDYDARPALRVPPQYPERCAVGARTEERVIVEFDVTKDGATENIRVIESTKACFNKAAISAVAKWRYRPKIQSGKVVERKNVQTTIVFSIGNDIPSELKVRKGVYNRLLKAEALLRGEGADPQKALIELAELEAEYGATFSRAELAAFHQVRAAARIEAGDYRGAVDDLRVVQALGMSTPEGVEAIDKNIRALEAAIAVQDAEAQQQSETEAAESEEAETPIERQPQ